MIWQKREVLLYLSSNFGASLNPSYQEMKKAYNKWPSDLYALFYGFDYAWSCNIFVGECLFQAGIHLLSNGKYHNAKQISNGEGSFRQMRKRDKNGKILIQPGDIACFNNGVHVEIVTQINTHLIAGDGFCSRGAGRGDGSDGSESCDSFYWWDRREIDSSSVNFFRVIR